MFELGVEFILCSIFRLPEGIPANVVAPVNVTKSPSTAPWLASVTVSIPEPLADESGFDPNAAVLRMSVTSFIAAPSLIYNLYVEPMAKYFELDTVIQS